MSDNFDLVKFLKESKAIENLNPVMKGLNDKSNKKSLVESVKKDLKGKPLTEDKLREKIREMVLAELGNNEEDPYRDEDPYGIDREELSTNKGFAKHEYETDGVKHYGVDKDKEYDKITAYNAAMKNRIYKDKPEHDIFQDSDLFDDNENYEDENEYENELYEVEEDEDDLNSLSDSELIRFAEDSALEELIVMDGEGGLANRDEIIQALKDQDVNEGDLYEAKKDEVEDAPADDEELDFSTDEEDVAEDPLQTAAAGATGDSKELINHLMTALDAAKAMSNEKLTTQILNTLKFAIDQSMGEN
jgi:hypothetical protein